MKVFHATVEDVVEPQTGFTSRADPNVPTEGGMRVLSAADLRGGAFEFGPPRRVGDNVSTIRYGVQPGDVFFKSRGAAFEAARLAEAVEPMVFAAPLVRLKVDPSKLLPDYLVWFLNSEPVQRQLEAAARGSVVQSVGPTELRQLSIPLPPIATQQIIANLEELRRREAVLMTRLQALRKTVLDAGVFAKFGAATPHSLRKETA